MLRYLVFVASITRASSTDQADEFEDIVGIQIALDEITQAYQRGFATPGPNRHELEKARLYIGVGCPTHENEFEYDDPRIHIKTRTISANLDDSFRTKVTWFG